MQVKNVYFTKIIQLISVHLQKDLALETQEASCFFYV